MKSFKKVLALLLSLAMVMTTLTVTAFADEEILAGKTELNAAFASGHTAGTHYYKLDADVSEGTSSSGGATLYVVDGDDITLDLNGKTLKETSTRVGIQVNMGGKLTLVDTAATKGAYQGYNGSTSYRMCGIYNKGELVLDGVVITGFKNTYTGSTTESKYGATIRNYSGDYTKPAIITIKGDTVLKNGTTEGTGSGSGSDYTYAGAGIYNTYGIVNIEGGTFTGFTSASKGGFYYGRGYNSTYKAQLNISGGTFSDCSASTGDMIALYGGSSTASITGGTFLFGDNSFADSISVESSSTLNITGGWFSKEPVAARIPSGNYATGVCADAPNEDAPYTVVDSETYTINYLSNDGTESVVTADEVTHKNDATLADYTPAEGTFMGWATAEGATEADYAAGATFQEVAASETNLYAVVTQAQTATATFFDGDTEITDYSTTTVAGSTITLPEALSKEGFVFNGWNDGNETYAAGADYTLEADTEFNADWTARTAATLDFYLDTTKIPSLTIEGYVDDIVTLPDLGITGYVLTGWATTPEALEAEYAVGDDYTIANATDVLYAVYEEAVAKATIGGNDYYYLSLADALTDLDSIEGAYTATITLLKDDTQTARVNLTTRTNATKAVITIDFNGKTLTYTGSNSGFVNVRAYNDVTITGEGTVDVSGATYKRLLYADVANASATVLNGNFATVVDEDPNTAFDFCSKMVINGGTWGADPSDSKYAADIIFPAGYVAIAQGTTPETWKVQKEIVAEVVVDGGDPQDASIDDIKTFVTTETGTVSIKLTKDVALDSSLGTTQSGSEITLDLNGKTITTSANQFVKVFKSEFTIDDTTDQKEGAIIGTNGINADGFIYINQAGALFTLNAGSIEVSGTNSVVWSSGSKTANIAINGGIVSNTGAGNALGTSNSYASKVDINGGEFNGNVNLGNVSSATIDGATINGDVSITTGTGSSSATSNLTVKSGVITGTLLANSGSTYATTVTVYGGEIGAIENNKDTDTFTVIGGTFGMDPESAANVTISETSEVNQIDDSTWEVVPKKMVSVLIEGGEEEKFLTLDDALGYVIGQEGSVKATVTLLDDASLSSRVDFAARTSDSPLDITLDLNGNTITYTGSNSGFAIVRAYNNMIITGDGTLDVSGSSYNRPVYSDAANSSVTILSGNFETIGTLYYTSTLSIKGGTWKIDPANATVATSTTGSRVAKGYMSVYNEGDDNYTVEVDPDAKVVATYNGVEYYTFDEVLEAAIADEGDVATIVLTGEDLGKAYTISNPGKKLIFDLDGKTLQPAEARRLFRFENGQFEIRNGKILANGELSVNGYIYVLDSTLVLDDVVFNGDPTDGNERSAVATSNGGVIYAKGSSVTLQGSCIKNCYDEASSGAIHLVRDGLELSVLVMNDSTIINCGAGVHGGAVSVGSNCYFIMEDGDGVSAIDGCDAPRGGAIYVDIVDDATIPATGDHGAGEVVFYSEMTNIMDCESTDVLSSAPIYSNGFVFDMNAGTGGHEAIVDDGMVYQMQTNAVFDTVSGTVGEKISLRFFVKIAYQTDKASEVKLAYTYDDVDYEIDPEEAGNYLEFVVDNINLYDAAKEITFYIKDEYIASNEEVVSAQDYFNMLEDTYFGSDRDEVLTFCAQTLALANDLVTFSATQEAGQKGVPVTFEGWEEAYILDDEPTSLDNVRDEIYTAGKTDTDKIAGVALNVTDQLAITYKIYTTKGSFITVTNSSGETMEVIDGEYIFTSTVEKPWYVYQEKLSPLAFDETFTINMDDKYGDTVHTITYSVNSYCFAMLNNPNTSTELQNLVLSIYRFGLSAKPFDV